jgi:hypothetical protein
LTIDEQKSIQHALAKARDYFALVVRGKLNKADCVRAGHLGAAHGGTRASGGLLYDTATRSMAWIVPAMGVPFSLTGFHEFFPPHILDRCEVEATDGRICRFVAQGPGSI